jgi:hypothetical protein
MGFLGRRKRQCFSCDRVYQLDIPSTVWKQRKINSQVRGDEGAPIVFIVWIPKHGIPQFCFLAWNSGAGPVRAYYKDCYDGRLDLDRAGQPPIPYFSNREEAIAWMLAHKGEQCQIDAGLADIFGVTLAEVSCLDGV